MRMMSVFAGTEPACQFVPVPQLVFVFPDQYCVAPQAVGSPARTAETASAETAVILLPVIIRSRSMDGKFSMDLFMFLLPKNFSGPEIKKYLNASMVLQGTQMSSVFLLNFFKF